jgi:hypothetical protein
MPIFALLGGPHFLRRGRSSLAFHPSLIEGRRIAAELATWR